MIANRFNDFFTKIGPSLASKILSLSTQGGKKKAYMNRLTTKMQSSSGNFSMCQQVPMMFLLLLVYLSAAACISEEIHFCPCWRRDVLIFKYQMSSTNHKMLLFVSWRNQHAIIRLATI